MSSKVFNKLILDGADAVSYSVDTATQFLNEEGVDIEAYINRGLSELNVNNSPKKQLNKGESYFRRAVLAAKIAHEYHLERSFGAVKFQKLVYLAEQTSSMNFTSNYSKQAAGPMDHKFIHSIKGEFERQGWFTVRQEGEYKKWVFTPGENVTAYETYFLKYFDSEIDNIQFLIDSFRSWKSDRVELVATIFSCWSEAKKSRILINDIILINMFYSFHKAKSKFTEEEIINTIRWMEENGVYPS